MGTSCSISCWTNEVRSYWYHKRTLWCSAHDISKNQFFSSHYGGSNEAERAAAAAVAEAAAAMMIMMPRSFVLVSANAPALMKTNPPFNCSPAKRRFFTTIDSPAAENAAEKKFASGEQNRKNCRPGGSSCVAAQLADRSLLTPEIRRSNPTFRIMSNRS